MKCTLKYSVFLRCAVFTLALSVVLGAMGYLIYQRDMIRFYQKYAGDAVNFLARRIDGNDLEECIRTKQKSKAYEELQILANDFKETHGLEFIYIILPISENPPNNMMDVFAAWTAAGKEAGTDGLTDLGNYTGDLYPPDVAREYLNRMDRNPDVTYFRNDTDFGNIYTAIRPIFNREGNPVSVLCADILIDDIMVARWRYAKFAFIAAIAFGFVLLLFLSAWFRKRIISPISRLEESASEFESKCKHKARPNELCIKNPEIHTGDEIESLSQSFVSMVSHIQQYAKDLVSKEGELSSMKDYLKKMDKIAYQDSLTGAGNKAAYEKVKTRLDWDILNRRAKFGIVMADLNYLKRVNDDFGHDKGNIYLTNMYRLLQKHFSQSAIFRIGGDEFVVVAEDEELEKVQELISDFKKDMYLIFENRNLEPWERVSTAIGFSVFQSKADDSVDSVFKRADEAMYEDKKSMHASRN